LVVLLTDPHDAGPGPSQLARALKLVRGRHLVICAAVGARELRSLAGRGTEASPLESVEHMHSRAAALDFLARRSRSLGRLRAAGAIVLDADAGELEQALLGGYSAVKAMGAL
jgi:hypothetical protein